MEATEILPVFIIIAGLLAWISILYLVPGSSHDVLGTVKRSIDPQSLIRNT